MSTFFITGVTGFVGSTLAAILAKRGHSVVGSTSSEAGLSTDTPGVAHKVVMRLGEDTDAARVGAGVDGVVHCAWDIRAGTGGINVRGTQRLVEAFHAAGARHQVFISTYSAHSRAVTEYGITKLAVERFMLDRGDAVARLGLTIGPGGIYRRISETLTRHSVVPLIDGGRHEVPIAAIGDVTAALAAILEDRLSGTFNLFNADAVLLRDVLAAIRSASKRRTLLVPVPSALLLAPLWVARSVGLTLPLDVDNVRALRANDGMLGQSHLSRFVPRPLTLAEMVLRAADGTTK